MRRILSTNLLRQLTLLEIIIDADQQPICNLKQIMGVDEKTVKKDIVAINQIIQPINISLNQMGNYVVEWLESYNLNFAYSRFLYTSTEFQLLEIILTEEKYTYVELAEKLFLSVSTLRRSLSRMNNVLLEYGMRILTNPVRIRGDKTSIYNLLYSYLKEKYLVTSSILSEAESTIIDEILMIVLPLLDQKWTFTKSELIKWGFKAYIMHMENRQTHSIGNSDIFEELVPLNEKFQCIYSIPIPEQLLKLIRLNEHSFPLLALNELRENENTGNSQKKAIEKILDDVEKEFKVINRDKKGLSVELNDMMALNNSPAYILNDLNTKFLTYLKRENMTLFSFLKKEFSKLDISEQKYFSQFCLQLIMGWPELMSELTKMKIGLFFTTSNAHIEFIEYELQKLFYNRILFVDLNNSAASELDKENVDLILTNINGLSTKKKKLCVSEYLEESDVKNIITNYKEWLRKDKRR